MFKSIKTILWATLVVSLSLGFASCSDSDDDGDDEKPVVVETHRIPTKIVEKYLTPVSDMGLDQEYVYIISYDDSNRVTSVAVSSESYQGTQNVVYNADGTIAEIGRYTYKYDTKEGRVEQYTDPTEAPDVFLVDEKGYPKSFTSQFENSMMKGSTDVNYMYDANRSVIKVISKEIIISSYYHDEYNLNGVATYSSYYHPFSSINMPTWVFFASLNMSGVGNNFFVSKQMLSEIQSKRMHISTTIATNAQKSNESSELIKYEVTKSEDNYPTELIESDGRETMYTITYKDAN